MMGLIVEAVESTRLEKGGPAQSVPRLSNAIFEAGQSVAICCPDHRSDSSEYANVTPETFPDWSALTRRYRVPEVAFLHLHGLWNPFQHRLSHQALRRGIPYAISPRGMAEPWALRHKRWKKRIAWWLYQRRDLQNASFVHATAESEKQQLVALGITRPIVVIPNGVPLPESGSSTREGERAGKTALFLGRIHPKKGLLLLAEAWARVRPSGWRMLVVGPDYEGHRQEVFMRVQSLGLETEWEFREARYGVEKSECFLESDVFLLPTYSENFGIAVAEALAYGLPVLTTTGTPWSGILEKRCGWIVEPSLEGIVCGLTNALTVRAQERIAMGAAGRMWMQADFAWPAIARQMVEAYARYVSTP